MYKIAYFVSHPIHYLVPLFKKMASHPNIEFKVYYFCDEGVKKVFNPKLGIEYQWDHDLLSGYNYEFLKNSSFRPNGSSFWGSINLSLLNIFRNNKQDAIVIHGWASLSCWLLFLASKIHRIPYYFYGDSSLFSESKIKTIVKKAMLIPVIKWSKGFLSSGSLNKAYYKNYGAKDDKFIHFPWSVDNDYFMSKMKELTPLKDKLRSKYKIPAKAVVFLFVAHLLPRKRAIDLLKVASRVKNNSRKYFLFVGDGPEKDKLIQFAKKNHINNVQFLGFCNLSEIPSIYALSDVFVLPSEREPKGAVVNEAMACGLPIALSTEVGCKKDLLVEGGNGFSFSVRDINRIDQISDLFENEELRLEMGKKSKELIKDWSFDTGIRNFIKHLDNEYSLAGSHGN